MPKLKKTTFICLLLIFLLLARSAWSRETVVVSEPSGECTLSVEADEEWHTLRLRAHHPECKGCNVPEDEIISILAAAFSKTEPPTLKGEYTSLFIGRLIDFPWLSHYLAKTATRDVAWNSRKGKPRKEGSNNLVARILFNKKILTPLQTELAKHGYRITGVMAEKVLVGSFRELPFYQGKINRGLVPFDAMVWFRLQKTE